MGKDKGLKIEDALMTMLALGAGMFLGGHILYGITNIGGIGRLFSHAAEIGFKNTVMSLFVNYFGGMVFYGGFLGALAALLIYTRFSKYVRRNVAMDIFAVAVPLFHVFGRIGCFLGGCYYGIESSWGFIVYDNTLNPDINGVVRLPVQLIEVAVNLCIFITLLILYNKKKFGNRLIFIYMLIYPVCRFILEFFRGDEIRGFIFGMSTSQFISILVFAAGAVGMAVSRSCKQSR